MSLLGTIIEGILEVALNTSPKKKEEAPKRDPLDKECPNLYIGKIIDGGMVKCEVVDVHKTNIKVKIIDIFHDRMETYLDRGKIYPVFKHSGWEGRGLEVWEISGKRMKRSSSQIILQWEEGLGWCWDLDS